MNQITFHAESESDTNNLGQVLAEVLPDGTTVALIGTLGSGKTRLVQSIAAACGLDREQVVSPTFVLCQPYHGRRLLYHMDAYRIADDDEFLELGPDEYFESDGITFVEWGDRVTGCLPPGRIEIHIDVTGDTSREFHIIATTAALFPLLPKIEYKAAVAFLMGRINYERTSRIPYGSSTFKLRRMRELLDRLGNPQEKLNIIHVAGTKGKGSTATMIAAILQAAGYRAGLYTSPHLHRLEERANVDGAACLEHELTELVSELKPIVESMDIAAHRTGRRGPTFFEVTTALALLHFVRRQVDAAVLEVGLGGRLDSTNVCRPLVSVITSISFDHTKTLGNTLAEIAAEKAGIIKRKTPVVSGVTAPDARNVIERVASQRQSRLYQVGTNFEFDYTPPRHLSTAGGESTEISNLGALRFRAADLWDREIDDDLPLAPIGRHQAANAAVAVAAIAQMIKQGWQIPEQAIRTGLASVQCPARIEVMSQRPTVVIDAAHNVASVEALVQTLDESFSGARRRILIFATSKDKDAEGMLARLLPSFQEIIVTRYLKNPRFVDPQRLAQLANAISGRHGWPKERPLVCLDPQSAWRQAQDWAREDDLICVAGSAFLAAEMRSLLLAGAVSG